MEEQNKYISYNEFCNRLQNIVFGYGKVGDEDKEKLYAKIVDGTDYADRSVEKFLKSAFKVTGEKFEKLKDTIFNTEEAIAERKKTLDKLIRGLVIKYFENKTLKEDGYCLKVNLLHKAVQMKDSDMLGFISDVDDENTRFVFVDFGDEDGAVKIDIDELIISQ